MCPMQLTDVRKDFARVNFTPNRGSLCVLGEFCQTGTSSQSVLATEKGEQSDTDVAGWSLSYEQGEFGFYSLISQVSDFFAESDGSFRMVREYSLSASVLFARKQLETCHPLKFNFHY